MYINEISIRNFRTFESCSIDFVHHDQDFGKMKMPKPKLDNINLLLGNNGFGKTTLLKAISLALLGPAVSDSGIYPYRLIRRTPGDSSDEYAEASIKALFTAHEQDIEMEPKHLEARIEIIRKGDLERLQYEGGSKTHLWDPIYRSSSDAFFFVGYGANRRVEKVENADLGVRRMSSFLRAQRIMSLFEEAYSLIPMNIWLPEIGLSDKRRYQEVLALINELLGEGNYNFHGEMENREYVFHKDGLNVPFPALSDGYRAFLGWVGDLLYHITVTCPRGKKMKQNKGIVMIDEIDLHLHPKWQSTVLPTLSKALPNVQFIVTSHSPLVVSSLEWMNIIYMKPQPDNASIPARIEQSVSGLDADQILLTDFFGMETTRQDEVAHAMKQLTLKAREGDSDAALKLMELMSKGKEAL